MNLDIEPIAEAFSTHRFAATHPYLSADIKWNIVGEKELSGRDAVIGRCEESAEYLETVSTTFEKLKMTRGERCMVIESIAQYKDSENQTSRVASCDVYQFSDERVVAISTYNIELKEP